MKRIKQIILLFSLFITCLSHTMLPSLLPSLHQAAADGNLEQVQHLLDADADVNATAARWAYDDSTPLHVAAFYGHKAIVNLLLDKGANVDAVNKYGRTPLHFAALNGRIDVVNLLIDRGAKVNPADNNSLTPLNLAKKERHKAVATLLKKAAGINAVNTYDQTSLPKTKKHYHTKATKKSYKSKDCCIQ